MKHISQGAEFFVLYLCIPFVLIYTEDIVSIIPTLWIIVAVVGSIGLLRNPTTNYPELWRLPSWT